METFSRRFSKDLVEIYAASEADFSGGVKTNYNHINYTANKFLDGFYMNLNGTVNFKLKMEKVGEELLTLRYSAGYNDAVVLLSVNGV